MTNNVSGREQPWFYRDNRVIYLRVDHEFMSQVQTRYSKSIKEAVNKMERNLNFKGRVTGSYNMYAGNYGNPKGTRG